MTTPLAAALVVALGALAFFDVSDWLERRRQRQALEHWQVEQQRMFRGFIDLTGPTLTAHKDDK